MIRCALVLLTAAVLQAQQPVELANLRYVEISEGTGAPAASNPPPPPPSHPAPGGGGSTERPSPVAALPPHEPRAWADRMEYYLAHPDVLAEKERRIKDTWVLQTWSDCAQTMLTQLKPRGATS